MTASLGLFGLETRLVDLSGKQASRRLITVLAPDPVAFSGDKTCCDALN